MIDEFSYPSEGDGIFGLGSTEKESAVVLLPVPWEGTVSYGHGTSLGPRAIYEASFQLDLFDENFKPPYESGVFLLPEDETLVSLNEEAKKEHTSKHINPLSEKLNQRVYESSKKVLTQGKILGVLGGEHSSPYGALKAVDELYSKKEDGFGIFHFDAHLDLRKAYEGYEHSHASIMNRAVTDFKSLQTLTQVGIRDFCEGEWKIVGSDERIYCYTDKKVRESLYLGTPFKKIAEEIVSTLPEHVWVSFDIDGLDPKLCPGTGTPVPGGLQFNEAILLIKELANSGRKIIGFDLCEVAPLHGDLKNQWDGNVGSRILYQLIGWALHSMKRTKIPTPR